MIDVFLDLVAIYFTLTDTGYAICRDLDRSLVEATYDRMLEILELAVQRFGRTPELSAWSLLQRERVLGEQVPREMYERLAAGGSETAQLALFVANNGRKFIDEVQQMFNRASARDTARKRYVMTFENGVILDDNC